MPDSNTKLLIHFDGINGKVPKGPNRLGNPRIHTAPNPVKFDGSSLYFPGGGDYFTIPPATAADWDFGTGDFTIDFWVRFNSTAATQYIIHRQVSSGYGPWLILYSSGSLYAYSASANSSWNILNALSFGAVSTGVWYHIALVRSGTTFYAFKDGALISTATSSLSVYASGVTPMLGSSNPAGNYFNGWLDEIRVAKGLARWTSAFTPPTSSQIAAPQDVLLMHNPGVQDSQAFYDQCCFNDASNYLRIMTRNSGCNSQISAASNEPSGMGPGCLYNPGTTLDYVRTGDSADYQFGSGDFTIDFWLYPSTVTGTHYVLGKFSSTNYAPWMFYQSGAALYFYSSGNNTSWSLVNGMTLSASMTAAWHHVAVTRQGTTWRGFYDGTLVSTVTASGAVMSTADEICIGAGYNGASSYGGYFDEVRISNVCRWTTSFTRPWFPYNGWTWTEADSGGIRLAGSRVFAMSSTLDRSAGVRLAGNAVASVTAVVPAAGVRLNGSASSSRTLNVTRSSGLRLGGAAQTTVITRARAISDISDGGWTDQAGSHDLWAAISEALPSDADYIVSSVSPATPDVASVAFRRIVDPHVSGFHTVQYRYGSEADGFVTVTQVLTGAQADAIADYGNLSLVFEAEVT
jgi:hypothetical protein